MPGLVRIAHLCSTWHPFGGWDRRLESPRRVTHLSGGDSDNWGWTAGALGHLCLVSLCDLIGVETSCMSI